MFGSEDSKFKDLANCIRFLSIDAVEKANSGHPGMPMGMADVATILFAEFLKFDPKNPKWLDRDRFILSAGHGSMLLYSLLFLTGYDDISLDDIKQFRQLHSKTAGHPEYSELEGIETTTGPLGQGLANAVGMAISEKLLKSRFGEDAINHKIYTIAGDGCLMEGISQEAISIAGHLALNNLIVLWDDNSISIDGDVNLTTSENMKMRFEACGWDFIAVDGHDYGEIRKSLQNAQKSDKPVLIACKTVIGYGSPSKEGTEKCHGSPLGKDEIVKTRQKLGWSHDSFVIPDELLEKWRGFGAKSQEISQKWHQKFASLNVDLPEDFASNLADFREKLFAEKANHASRKSSQIVLEFLTQNLPQMIGGSADLTGSVLTKTSHTFGISKDNFAGRYIHYGVREHAMGAIMNGISLHGNFIPYGGTFLVFSDYMKPAIRLSALMQRQVIYILTHDSIGLGEDGPTHQPIEHLAMLRGVVNLNVFRPCDAKETLDCFEIALQNKNTPSAMILSRQNLPFLSQKIENLSSFGAYEISPCDDAQIAIFATGSEVEIAVEAQKMLAENGLKAKVVSIPCFEIFEKQSEEYKRQILGGKNMVKVAIEAGIEQGWRKYIGEDGIFVGMSSFGASAKASDLYEYFGITAKKVVELVVKKIK
jgi:transketolase